QPPSPAPIIGRWDLTVRGARAGGAAWLEVRHSGIDTLVGQFVGTGGSARPIARVDFKDGTLGFTIPRQWERADGHVVVSGRAGEWQSVDVTLVGRLVTVALNGKTIICETEIPGITGGALDSREAEPGPLLLQGDHGPVDFRNLIVTPAK